MTAAKPLLMKTPAHCCTAIFDSHRICQEFIGQAVQLRHLPLVDFSQAQKQTIQKQQTQTFSVLDGSKLFSFFPPFLSIQFQFIFAPWQMP